MSCACPAGPAFPGRCCSAGTDGINFETRKRLQHYTAGVENPAKAGHVVYISSTAQPVSRRDALPVVLDRVLGGDDVVVIHGGDEGRVLLESVGDHLVGQRSRILRATEVLPGSLGLPVQAPRAVGPSKAGVPDDELLAHGVQALTVLDQTCDRIVLLVSDAHALQHSAFRYIQLVSRAGSHLQFVFCGTRKLFDVLNEKEFAWLHARLMAGLVVTLAAPDAKAWNISPSLPAVADEPAAWVVETAVPPAVARRLAAPISMRSRILCLGALALLGVGGAAYLTRGTRNGEADGPAASQRAAAVVQSPATPELPAVPAPGLQAVDGAASHAGLEASRATPDAPAAHPPVMAGTVLGATPGPAPSMSPTPLAAAASRTLITVWPQPETGMAEAEPGQPKPPELGQAQSPGGQDVPSVPSRVAVAPVVEPPGPPEPPPVSTPGTQMPDGVASRADPEAGPAAPNAPAPQPPVMASDVQGAGPGSPSGAPLVAATGTPVTVSPQAQTGVAAAEPGQPRVPEPQPGVGRSRGRQLVSVTPPRFVAAPSSRPRVSREGRDQPMPLPADDHWLTPQPASSSLNAPESRSPRYIGSYGTNANGVRLFHSEP